MSVSSSFLWRFLEDVWDLLPTEDRELFQAYWSGLIQVGSNLEQKTLEASLSTEMARVPVFLTERWNRFVMDEDTSDLFEQQDGLTLLGLATVGFSKETALLDTLVVTNASGVIHQEEAIRLFDEEIHDLQYGKIIEGTFSVRPYESDFEFTANRDYAVSRVDGTIRRIPTGRISGAELLRVNYQHEEYTRDVDFAVDELELTIGRTPGSTILSGGMVVARYTYNGTATSPMSGDSGAIDASSQVLYSANKDFSSLLPNRTLTIISGPNAGTYPINAVLDPHRIQISTSFIEPQETDVAWSVNAFPHGTKVSRTIKSIPFLQDRVDVAGIILAEGVDYQVSDGVLSMRSAFPLSPIGPAGERKRQMWGEVTKVDNETPYRNFGVLIDFFRENSEDYKLALQGLWYTFWTGSTPGNLQRGLHILLGLPFARNAGRVSSVNVATGRIAVTDPRGQILTYLIPDGLSPTVAFGDSVERFDSLTTGIQIIDRNNEPGFVSSRLGRAGIRRYLTSNATLGQGDTDETRALVLLENHLFLPQVLAEAVTKRVNVGELVTFLQNMKPDWTDYVFSFSVEENETVLFGEEVGPPQIGFDVSATVGNNPWNQAFQFGLFIIEGVVGQTLAGGTQATGNFFSSGVDFVTAGIDEDDYVFFFAGLFPGPHRVIKRINANTLSLDIPDIDMVGSVNIHFAVVTKEVLMDHDAVNLRRENILLPGTDFAVPSGLNTKTDAGLSGTTLSNEETKALLLVDLGNAGAEVQAITDADVENDEIDVGTSPGVVTRNHEIASCALKRTNNVGPAVTDAFAI